MGVRLSYIGSTMRKLLTDTDYNILQPSTEFFDPNDPSRTTRACRTTRTAPTWTSSRTRARASSTRCRSSSRAGGAAGWRSTSPTPTPTPTRPSPTRATARSASSSTTRGSPTSDRGPDPNVVKHRVVANATWDIPVGKNRKWGSTMPGWAEHALRRLDGLDDLPGAQRPQPDAVLQRLLLVQPVEHREAARRPRQLLLLRVAARRDRRPEHRRTRASSGSTRRPTRSPAPGQFGNAKKGSLQGPGTWIVNFSIYKDIVATRPLPAAAHGAPRQRVQPPAVLPGLRGRLHQHAATTWRTGSRQRRHGRARGGHHRQRRGLRAGTGLPHRHKSHVLASKRAAWRSLLLRGGRHAVVVSGRPVPRIERRRASHEHGAFRVA